MPRIRNIFASRSTDFGRVSIARAMYPEWQQSRIVVTLGTAPNAWNASVSCRWYQVSSSDSTPRKSPGSLSSMSNGTMNWYETESWVALRASASGRARRAPWPE